MKYLLVITLMIMGCSVFAQSKKTIVENKIKLVSSYEQDIHQGEKELILEKEEYYNTKGELIELKEFDEKGRIKKWEKYSYSSEGQLTEEKILNYRGNTEKRIEHTYQNGIKVGKLYFDDKNRLYKKKRYEFKYHK